MKSLEEVMAPDWAEALEPVTPNIEAMGQFLRDEISGDTAFGARQRLFQTARHPRFLFCPNP